MKTIIGVILMLCLATPSNAKLYKWVDENGVTHFSNVAPSEEHQVETNEEAQGNPESGSQGLDNVLKSYKEDESKHAIKEREKRTFKKSGKSEGMADYYADRIKDEEARVRDREADLEIVKKESYSDAKKHKDRVRYYERRLEKARVDLESVKAKYKKAKFGN